MPVLIGLKNAPERAGPGFSFTGQRLAVVRSLSPGLVLLQRVVAAYRAAIRT
jgi:hypothetical protein